jgi:hypothetical protein
MLKGRIANRFVGTIGLFALAGCSGGTPDQPPADHGETPKAAALAKPAPAKATDPSPGPQKLSSKSDSFEFSYKWPAEAAAIPELDRWLKGNGEKMRAQNAGEAATDAADAKKQGYNFNAHSYDESFSVAANTPQILVLLSEGYVYTGGAHGMPISTVILWDKAAKKRLATTAMIDIPRLVSVGNKRFCDALDKEREKRRGEPVRHDDPDELSDFVNCVDLTKEEIVPVAKDPKTATTLDTIRVVIGPYDAGPYAEGTYIIDLPVDAALLTAVKAPYRGWFNAVQ